jgi:hypothetical protein
MVFLEADKVHKGGQVVCLGFEAGSLLGRCDSRKSVAHYVDNHIQEQYLGEERAKQQVSPAVVLLW